VSHIRCSTARHERGCAACPRHEQGKATLRRLAAVKPDKLIRAFSMSPFPFFEKNDVKLGRLGSVARCTRSQSSSLWMKGMLLDAIHGDLVRTLGKDAVACSTVTKYARSVQFSGRKEVTSLKDPNVKRSPVDEAILTALAEFPFSPVCELSRRICLPRSTVHRHRHLMQLLRFTVRHL
jgi:hypothetical protein